MSCVMQKALSVLGALLGLNSGQMEQSHARSEHKSHTNKGCSFPSAHPSCCCSQRSPPPLLFFLLHIQPGLCFGAFPCISHRSIYTGHQLLGDKMVIHSDLQHEVQGWLSAGRAARRCSPGGCRGGRSRFQLCSLLPQVVWRPSSTRMHCRPSSCWLVPSASWSSVSAPPC